MQAAQIVTSDWQRLTSKIPVRSAVRFPVQLPIRLQTEWGDNIEATTEDVSATGLLFRGHGLPRVDSRIEFTITMPGPVMGSLQDVLIHCVGRVVRHQSDADEDVAAAVIDQYSLRV